MIKRYIVNLITSSRILFAAIIVTAAFYDNWWLVLICAVLALISDADGKLARRWKAVSNFGAFFDPLADKVFSLSLLWVIAWHLGYPIYWVIPIITIAAYDVATTTMRLVIAKKQAMPAITIAKHKTVMLLVGMIVSVLGIILGSYGELLLIVGAILVAVASFTALVSLGQYIWAVSVPPSRTKLEYAQKLADIDFDAWHNQHNISCLLLDAEGTLTNWGGDQVEKDIVAATARAKSSGIDKLGIVTNIRFKQIERVKKIAEQCGIQAYFVAQHKHQLKPSAYLIKSAISHFKVNPKNTGMVGDKLADVVAAKRAGLARVAWINRLGKTDHPGDKFLYRPIEPVLKKLFR